MLFNQTSGSNSTTTIRPTTDPTIGNGALPAGFRGAANRAFVRDVQRDELTSDQLNRLLQSNSPYIQQAQRAGTRGAAARGLGNSSIAAGASQAAAIQAGMPIAQADAAAFGQAAESNQRFLNEQQMSLERNETSLAAAGMQAGAATANAELAARNALQMQRERLAFEGEQGGLDRMFREGMANLGHMHNLGMLDAQTGARLMEMAQGFQFDIGRMGFQQDWQAGQNSLNRQMEMFNGFLGLVMQDQGFNNAINVRLLEGAMNPDLGMTPDSMRSIASIFNQNRQDSFFGAYNNLFSQFDFGSLFGSFRRRGG